MESNFIPFSVMGREYRTNADASIVEGKDGSTWHRTYSLNILMAARRVIEAMKGNQ